MQYLLYTAGQESSRTRAPTFNVRCFVFAVLWYRAFAAEGPPLTECWQRILSTGVGEINAHPTDQRGERAPAPPISMLFFEHADGVQVVAK